MVANASMFTQVLSLVDRLEFSRSVKKHDAEKAAKGFSCWEQLVSMLFSQLGGANSLREISGGLATAFGKLRHLGMKKAPPKSTLAYANANRPWQVFEDVFYSVLERARNIAKMKKRKFRFKNTLKIIDATVVSLCLKVFDWARFRRTKGALKLHLMLDHQGCLPSWALVTDGATHEINAVRRLSFKPGTIVAMDRAYVDYELFSQWTESNVYFVTRTKSNMRYRYVKWNDIPEHGNVIGDEEIELTGPGAEQKCPHRLRLVIVWDEKNERPIELVTNIFHLSAKTIGEIYRERWQIEIFFKALKQNLKIKTFVGTSENAVLVQIWTALVVILILKFMQLKSTFGWSLSNLAAMVRMNLLTYRDLWAWLDSPYDVPIVEPKAVQLLLFKNSWTA